MLIDSLMKTKLNNLNGDLVIRRLDILGLV